MKKLIPLLIFLLTASAAFSATIAVIPYRVDPPVEKLTGREYSRLLSLGILLMKNIEVTSPEEVDIAMQQTGARADRAISGEDLHAIGLKCRADYILIGTVRRLKGTYYFENILFSVKSSMILSRNSNRGNNLYSVVHQEIKDTLINFSDKKSDRTNSAADIAFITDMSYSMSSEWGEIRGAILDFSSALISRYGIDTRVYLLPYSDRRSFESVSLHHNSIRELRERLNSLTPSGNADTKSLLSMLNHSLSNIKWRRDASKRIIIINNSKTDSLFLAEKYSTDAKRNNVKIDVISGGRVSADLSDAERLAELTGGSNFSISYHQRVHDSAGGKHEIYLQRGRVFHSMGGYTSWRNGILTQQGKNPKYVKTPEALDEIFQKKINPWPEKLVQIISDGAGIQVMEKNPVQSNISDILESLSGGFIKASQQSFTGKALISDGRLSQWVKIHDPVIMRRFEEYSGKNFYLKCGFNIRTSSGDAYGIDLVPVAADITSDYIPDFARTTLTDIVKNREYYTSKGIGTPPVWFIEIKIDNIERYDLKRDIRE